MSIPTEGDVPSLAVVASISSSTSLAVLASSSIHDILAVQLSASLSAISVGGFVPVQTDKEVAAPVEEDPFETDPMLAMPKFRFTRSAPPTPSRKLVADRHIGYYVLQPSLSVPIDMDVFG